jgi:2-oxoisovalerate dehydrogenase E1 component
MGDFTYRTREEVEAWKGKCPIGRLRGVLAHHGVAGERLAAIDAEVAAAVARARGEAEAAPPPAPATALDDVYAATAAPVPAATSDPPGGPPRTWAQATLEALDAAMAADAGIFVMGEGIGVRGGNFATTTGLFAKYGAERLCDTPICERGFVGLACGAAMNGARPVIDFMFADFVLDAWGEIVNQIAKMRYMSSGRLRMPVVLRGCIGIGHSAATHHSGSYYGQLAQVPGLRVVVPSNAADAKGLLARALAGDDPVLFLEHRELFGAKTPVPEGHHEIPFGVANVVRRGRHVTVVALARMVRLVEGVCDRLAAEGIEVELVDPRTVSPLDTATILESVGRTGRLLVVDEPPAACGFAAEVAARVADEGFDFLDAPVRRLCGAFVPTPYAPSLEAVVVPDAEQVMAAIRALAAE